MINLMSCFLSKLHSSHCQALEPPQCAWSAVHISCIYNLSSATITEALIPIAACSSLKSVSQSKLSRVASFVTRMR